MSPYSDETQIIDIHIVSQEGALTKSHVLFKLTSLYYIMCYNKI